MLFDDARQRHWREAAARTEARAPLDGGGPLPPPPHLAPPRTLPQSAPFASGGMQFAVADVEWWRSPWPSHPLLQGVMHRLPRKS